MLARLFWHGASRQRIVKAYCFTERKSGEVATHLASEGVRLPCIDGATPALRLDPRRPNRVWIDTGNLWLHEPGVRKARFHEIQRVTEALADALGGVGGRLIPAGVRPPGERSWSTWLAGDQHFVEVLDDVEREVFCNLLRGVVPGLRGDGARRAGGAGGITDRISSARGEHGALRDSLPGVGVAAAPRPRGAVPAS
jgi:hypothetical protein